MASRVPCSPTLSETGTPGKTSAISYAGRRRRAGHRHEGTPPGRRQPSLIAAVLDDRVAVDISRAQQRMPLGQGRGECSSCRPGGRAAKCYITAPAAPSGRRRGAWRMSAGQQFRALPGLARIVGRRLPRGSVRERDAGRAPPSTPTSRRTGTWKRWASASARSRSAPRRRWSVRAAHRGVTRCGRGTRPRARTNVRVRAGRRQELGGGGGVDEAGQRLVADGQVTAEREKCGGASSRSPSVRRSKDDLRGKIPSRL
jgi:hypothetical protein